MCFRFISLFAYDDQKGIKEKYDEPNDNENFVATDLWEKTTHEWKLMENTIEFHMNERVCAHVHKHNSIHHKKKETQTKKSQQRGTSSAKFSFACLKIIWWRRDTLTENKEYKSSHDQQQLQFAFILGEINVHCFHLVRKIPEKKTHEKSYLKKSESQNNV